MCFSDYFIEKIRTIRSNFPPPNPTACPGTAFAGNPLLTFESLTDEFVLKIINSTPAKSCERDPIPTMLLYENLDILLPTIMNIINTSLTTGIVPRDLKTAVVKPLLKKPSLDKNLFKNYRPFLTFHFCPKSLKSHSPQTSLPSTRKQHQQSLSVNLSSRTQHRDRFVAHCKRYPPRSGQWQHFCSSFVGSFCRFWHYWPPNSPLPPELCFWHSVYCTPMVSVIPLG